MQYVTDLDLFLDSLVKIMSKLVVLWSRIKYDFYFILSSNMELVLTFCALLVIDRYVW